MTQPRTWSAIRWDQRRVAQGDDVARELVLVAGPTHEIVVSWWPAGTVSEAHAHGDSHAWVHVLRGDVVEDHWRASPDGAWRHEEVVHEPLTPTFVPVGTIRKVRAQTDAEVLVTYTPPRSRTPDGRVDTTPAAVLRHPSGW